MAAVQQGGDAFPAEGMPARIQYHGRVIDGVADDANQAVVDTIDTTTISITITAIAEEIFRIVAHLVSCIV